TCNFELAFQNDFYGLGINSMFFLQNAPTERIFGVVVFNRNDSLQHDRPSIEIFVDKVNGTAGKLHAVIESLLLRFEPRKRGQQRRVNIQNALRESGYKK